MNGGLKKVQVTGGVRNMRVSDLPPTLFRKLLVSSMRNGIRPVGDPEQGKPWTYNTLSEIVGTTARTVGNWCRGDTLPADIRSLARAFYGSRNDRAYDNKRRELYDAFAAAKVARNVRVDYQKSRLDHRQIFPVRAAEVAELSMAISGSVGASVAVLGPPRVGKTTLTQRIRDNEQVVACFGQRCWLVELATVTDAAGLRLAITQTIGLNPVVTKFHAALRRLGRKRTLLILDDLDTSWKQDPLAVQECLQRLAAQSNISMLVSLRSSQPLPSWVFTRQIRMHSRYS